MTIPIKIITLQPESANVKELLGQLHNQQLEAITQTGVDGRRGSPELLPGEKINQEQSLAMRLIQLTSGEIGCYLSHLRTIREAYEAGIPRICILEDDVLIEPGFKATLEAVEPLPDHVEFVRLMGLKIHRRKIVAPLAQGHHLTRPLKGVCGTQGYVINRSGMKKVIAAGSNLSEPIDKFYDHFWDIDLFSFTIEPHLIWERPRIASSIKKESRSNASKKLPQKIKTHRIKLLRGLKRRCYMLLRYKQFFPASKPNGSIGRTARIR